MSESQLATVQSPRASDQLAAFLGIDKPMMLETLKAQCFKGKRPDEVSDSQLAAFVSTANVLQVNPLIPGMLYAYPERNGGITPILGPDGVFKKLDEMIASGKLRGYECDVKMGADGKPESATAIIHRSGDQVSAKYVAYFSEWSVTSNPNWQARPRHMIWVRAIKQAARQVIHGLPMDADEYQIQQMQNVTPEEEQKVERADPPKRERKAKGANAIVGAETSETASAATTVVPPAAEVVKTPEPVAEAPKPAETVQPRAFLKDKEKIVAVCEVVELSAININVSGTVTPSIQATVKGEFVGVVYHIGGGEKDGDGIRPAAPWAVGTSLKLTITGKANQKAAGKVQNFVEGAEATQSVMEV